MSAPVERQIQYICEPNRLLLVWEPPLYVTDRTRWVVGELSRSLDSVRFRYIRDAAEFADLNAGRTIETLRASGYAGYPTFKIEANTAIVKQEAAQVFLRRIPARERPDFRNYLKYFRLDAETHLSDFALLGLTMAKLPSDGFSIVDPLDGLRRDCDFIIEIAGNRHYAEACKSLAMNEIVSFLPEVDNPKDANAVQVLSARGEVIGYVGRVQARAFRQWLSRSRVEGQIIRLNGEADRPRIYLLVQVREAAEAFAA